MFQLKNNVFLIFVVVAICGCASSSSFVGNSGPTTKELKSSAVETNIKVLKIDKNLNESIEVELQLSETKTFVEFLTSDHGRKYNVVNVGDFLDIRIIESAPAVLFTRSAMPESGSFGSSNIADFLMNDVEVDVDGNIRLPFIGRFKVTGQRPEQIENYIASALKGKANSPQILVEHKSSLSNYITVIGDLKKPRIVPLRHRKLKLLDVLADSEGFESALFETDVLISRKNNTIRFPMQKLLQEPKLNVFLSDDDIVTLVGNPFKAVVLGAVTSNKEVRFSSSDNNLVNVLGKVGGFNDSIADPRGVFIFRKDGSPSGNAEKLGGAIFTLDMKLPESYLLANDFKVKDGDIVYVASASSAELQKFINIVSASVFSVTGLKDLNSSN